MRPRDRGVHRHVPRDQALRIGIGQQRLQHSIPGAITGVTAVTLPERLPRTKLTPRHIPPGDTRPESVDDPIHDRTVISERMALLTRVRRKQRPDQRPLLIRHSTEPRLLTRRHITQNRASTPDYMGDTP